MEKLGCPSIEKLPTLIVVGWEHNGCRRFSVIRKRLLSDGGPTASLKRETVICAIHGLRKTQGSPSRRLILTARSQKSLFGSPGRMTVVLLQRISPENSTCIFWAMLFSSRTASASRTMILSSSCSLYLLPGRRSQPKRVVCIALRA